MAIAAYPPASDLRPHNRRLVEAFVLNRDPAALAEDVVLRDFGQERPFAGRPAVMTFWSAFFGVGFAPAQAEVQTLVIGEDAAALSLLFRGWHAGVFMGLPPTAQQVVLPMVLVCHIAAGCIRRAELYYNAGTLLRQLGLGL